MVTITTASAGQLHLALNDLEKSLNKVAFTKTRREIKHNVAGIVGVFILDIILIVFYAWIDDESGRAFLFSIAISGLLLSTLFMYDIVGTVFKVPAHIKAPPSTTEGASQKDHETKTP
jgi:hypothetical protein